MKGKTTTAFLPPPGSNNIKSLATTYHNHHRHHHHHQQQLPRFHHGTSSNLQVYHPLDNLMLAENIVNINPILSTVAVTDNPDLSTTTMIMTWRESENMDPQTAALLLLPLLAYKISSTMNGQRLLWYLDLAIALAVTSFLVRVFQS